MHEIKPIIDPLPREELLRELTPDRKVRDTKRAGNEIYIFTAAECPALMREGRWTSTGRTGPREDTTS